MRTNSSWPLAACMIALTLAACGDDDPAADRPDGWMVGAEEMGQDQGGSPDQGAPDLPPPLDMPDTPDSGPDAPPDMPDVPDAPPDLPDAPPDMPPPGSLEMTLVQAPWLAIVDVQAVGQGDVGVAAGLEFQADGSVALSAEGTRRGRWQTLQSGSVYIFDLLPTPAGESDELLLDPIKQGDAVVAMSIRGASQIVFEQHALRSARDITVSDITGRWQALQGVPDEQGNTVYLAMRVNADATFEYGITSQGNFAAFLTAPGSTAWLRDQRSFWYFVPPLPQPNTISLAGQLLLTAGGDIRMFAPFEYTDPRGQKTLLSVELAKVAQFRP